ncbi:hypothetical protein WJX73_005291 [Symbiochloris irregularis]|uniref:Fibronectin type-III domain-containing protein n=1 Tax=Symbiochloris irregularis TaxID=706552 RepID=A0AAW1PZ38_9CHLO
MPPKKAAAGGAKKGAAGKKGAKGAKDSASPADDLNKEREDLLLRIKTAEDDTQHFQLECGKLEETLRQYRARFAAADTDKGDILAFRQTEIERKETRIRDVLKQSLSATQQLEDSKLLVRQLEDQQRELLEKYEGTSEQLQVAQAELTFQCSEVARLVARAGDAERLTLELRGLQADHRLVTAAVKRLTIANAGRTRLRIVHGDAWMVAVSHRQLEGETPILRNGSAFACCGASKLLCLTGGLDGYDATDMNTLPLAVGDTMQWEVTSGPRAASQLFLAASVCVNRTSILCFGGKRGNELSNEVQIFSTISERWQTPEMLDDVAPCPRYGACLFSVHSQVYMFGGCGAEGMLNDTWMYDLARNQWSPITPTTSVLPAGRMGASLCMDEQEGRLWVVGGNSGGGSLSDLYYLDLTSCIWSPVRALGTQIQPRQHHCAVMMQHFVVISGGVQIGPDGSACLVNDVQAFDPEPRLWACINAGTPAEDIKLDSNPHAALHACTSDTIYSLTPSRGTELLEQLQTVHLTTPDAIQALREAHKDDRVIVRALTISPTPLECTCNSISVTWTPPTKNSDRIAGYKAMLSTLSGVVREVYRGPEPQCKAEGLRPHVEYVFCVKAFYEDGSFLWSEPVAFTTKS